MSNQDFYENKMEEVLQLLSAQNELIEKQTLLMEEFLVRLANIQAEHSLQAYLQDERQKGNIGAF